MHCDWKANWQETQSHLEAWWKRNGLVVSVGSHPRTPPRPCPAPPPLPAAIAERYTDAEARALRNHYSLALHDFPGDSLPIASTDIGPGSLALFLGSEPGFAPQTVWFEPSIQAVADPETLPPLTFDPASRWWQVTEATCRACAELGRGHYLTGCPDLIENIDILSALRDPQTLMIDMIERPDWVEAKVWEINQAFFEAYQRIYDIIKLPDGSSCFGAFSLWGPGKTVKVQCDAAAMFSPAMFDRFVVPALTAQCAWLDCSMFHLDGTQCIDKLDSLLAIEPLDAIEWTPQAGIEGGGHPRWFELYRRILNGGKAVQIIGVQTRELRPLLDAIGTRGVYITMWPQTRDEAQAALDTVAAYRY